MFSVGDLRTHAGLHVRARYSRAGKDDRRIDRRYGPSAGAVSDLVEPDVRGDGSPEFRHRFRPKVGRLFAVALSLLAADRRGSDGQVERGALRTEAGERAAR